MWKRIKEAGYPSDSRMVFITDGKNVNMAHWFADTLLPRTKEEQKKDAENQRGGAVWANQHWRIIGNAYLSIEAVTHWAETHDLPMPEEVGG